MSRTEPLADDAGLHLLAEHLCSALAADELEPSLIRVVCSGAGFELGTLPLDGDHPSQLLFGHRAEPDVHAFGVASRGRAYHLGARAEADREAAPVAMVTIVSRTDELATAVRGIDPIPAGIERPEGQLVDLLTRVLDRPTPPPPQEASGFWAAEWLSALARHPEPNSLEEALVRHPAMQLLAGHHDDADRVELISAFHRVCTWSRLRTIAETSGWQGAGISQADAAWLDDGSFARHLLARCPPLPELRAAALDPLPDDVARPVSALLDELGVPTRLWPDVATAAPCR